MASGGGKCEREDDGGEGLEDDGGEGVRVGLGEGEGDRLA